MKIQCTTLFDITKTGQSGRRGNLGDMLPPEIFKLRNQQSNLETLLQIISLRCQPEDITTPIRSSVKRVWGNKYPSSKLQHWSFSFTVHHSAVFRAGGDELGSLKVDCIGVPMIVGLEETTGLISTLDLSKEYKNIHFEVLDE